MRQRQPRLPNPQDIARARELIRQYDGVNLHALSDADLAKMIGIHYRKVRGVRPEKLPREQAYRIAERLYTQDSKIVSDLRKSTGIEGRFVA